MFAGDFRFVFVIMDSVSVSGTVVFYINPIIVFWYSIPFVYGNKRYCISSGFLVR